MNILIIIHTYSLLYISFVFSNSNTNTTHHCKIEEAYNSPQNKFNTFWIYQINLNNRYILSPGKVITSIDFGAVTHLDLEVIHDLNKPSFIDILLQLNVKYRPRYRLKSAVYKNDLITLDQTSSFTNAQINYSYYSLILHSKVHLFTLDQPVFNTFVVSVVNGTVNNISIYSTKPGVSFTNLGKCMEVEGPTLERDKKDLKELFTESHTDIVSLTSDNVFPELENKASFYYKVAFKTNSNEISEEIKNFVLDNSGGNRKEVNNLEDRIVALSNNYTDSSIYVVYNLSLMCELLIAVLSFFIFVFLVYVMLLYRKFGKYPCDIYSDITHDE
eukprot:GAHX01002228.1.p1 GENE.GAHX01002228.1~~GAHX01002228.1.p1  ORF type:complete len:330 (+),score=43.94 GAHX01002228.1:246-1235(+)